MRLKTLKDLDIEYDKDYGDIVNVGELRQEAIKRIKNCCGTCISKCKACSRDMWFNNISEEDLK